MTVSIESLAKDVGTALKQQGLKLAIAESCTGGGLCYWITSIPGSSAWFERGFVTYSNIAKIEMLGIRPVTIESFGAVSEPTVREMAENVLRESRADISIATTGIAGPDGGSVAKPVGTVWTAFAGTNRNTHAYVDIFTGDRLAIRLQTIERALESLLKWLG